MADITFPITGLFQEVLMSLELIIVAVLLEFSFFFFMKYLRNRKNAIPSFVEFDWGMLFLTLGNAVGFFIVSDYFPVVPRVFYLFIGYITTASLGIILVYHLESRRTMFTKYIFTLFISFLLIAMVILFFAAPEFLQSVASLSLVPALILIVIYFLRLIRKIWARYKLYSIGLILGILFWFNGYSMASDMIVKLLGGIHIRLIGDISTLIGMAAIGMFLNWIPSLSEIGWQNKLKYIIFATRNGALLYSQDFRGETQEKDIIVAGAFAALDTFMKEAIKDDMDLSKISKGKDVFLLEKGTSVLAILAVEQELEILKYFLKESVRQFELFHQDNLRDWSGSTELFKWTKYLLNDIMTIKQV